MHNKIPKVMTGIDKKLTDFSQALQPNTFVRFAAQVSSIQQKTKSVFINQPKFQITVKNDISKLKVGDYFVLLGLFVKDELLEGNITKITLQTKQRMQRLYQMMQKQKDKVIKGRQMQIGHFIPVMWKK